MQASAPIIHIYFRMQYTTPSRLSLSDVGNAVPEFYVLKIDKVANQRIKEGRDIIKLNLGKSEVPMPKYVADEMSQLLYDTNRREVVDSQGLFALREEIANEYRTRWGARVSPNNVFINNGTSPFFLSLFLILVNPGEDILLPRPYYPTYVAAATMARANKTFYAIRNGRIDMDELARNFAPGKTRIVFLNSPGNPLGNVVSEEEMRRVLDIVNGQAHVICDEIYDGFVYDHMPRSIYNVYNPDRDQVIVLNGFSKIHHMYTRRLGFAIVPDAFTGALLKFQQHTVVCVDPVTQFGGLISFKNKSKLIEEEIHAEVEEYARRLRDCESLMSRTRLKVIPPGGSFYMGVDVSGYLSGNFPHSLSLAQKLLDEADVAITPAEDFGGTDFFRVSLTSSRVVEGVKRMCEYVLKLG